MFEFNKNHKGRYGEYGGSYIAETLVAAMQALEESYRKLINDDQFNQSFYDLLCNYTGRPTPLTEVARFSQAINGPRIFLKREDLLHTGAHKINNALGQCLLAKKMGKQRIIGETGAGQHGVATATACAYLGLDCVIYMGAKDIERQYPNVQKMRLLGAEVRSVKQGTQTLKDAVNEALRDLSLNYENTHYCLGSALGPHPYPEIVANFQSVIGYETKEQCAKLFARNPDLIVACVGGGSNAIGIFSHFIENKEVQLIGVEGGGRGANLGEHAARFRQKVSGVLHGCHSYLLQNQEGQIADTHSISAGLDYPMVGPQHAHLYDTKRANYVGASDEEALAAFHLLCKTEGIIPALESSHALAHVMKIAKEYSKDQIIVVNLSGRGDKDLPQIEDGRGSAAT